MVADEHATSAPPRLHLMGIVQEDGSVSFLSNKVFTAAGKTRAEFEREVRHYYVPSRFAKLDISVTDPPTYFVKGEVGQPGMYVLMRPTPVLTAIRLAGGFTKAANIRKVQIIHSLYGPHPTESNHVIDCVKAQRDPETDMGVAKWDKIVVPRSFWRRVFHPDANRLTNGLSQ